MSAWRDWIRFRYDDGTSESFDPAGLVDRVGVLNAAVIASALVGYSAGFEQPASLLGRPIYTKVANKQAGQKPRAIARVGLVMPDLPKPTKH